mgnify:CR=1 FL=1
MFALSLTAFSRNYVSPRSVRSNVNWTGPVLKNRFSTSLDLTYSLNLNQSSAIDRNFRGEPAFLLPDEDGRPVFVQESSIVPATGATAAQDARFTSRFSRVNEMVSDLRSESYQGTLRLSPLSFSSRFSWSAWYTHTLVREQFRGFSSTAGNPLDVAWAPPPVPRLDPRGVTDGFLDHVARTAAERHTRFHLGAQVVGHGRAVGLVFGE